MAYLLRTTLAFCLIMTFSINVQAQSADEFLKKGLEATQKGDIKGAVSFFEKTLTKDPQNISALQGLGVNYLFLENYAKGEEALTKALKIDGNNKTTLMTLGRLFEAQADYDQAHANYSKVIKLAPNNVDALLAEGRIFNKAGNFKGGLKFLQKAVKLAPMKRSSSEELAFAYANLGKFKEAIVIEEALHKRFPKDKDIIMRCALLQEALKDPTKAIKWYERAKSIDPKDDRIHVRLAELYSATDQIDHSITSLKRAIDLQEGNISNYIGLGRIYGYSGKLKEGIKILEQALKIDGDNKDILGDIGYLYLYDGKWKKSKDTFKHLLALAPKNKLATDGLQQVRVQEMPQFVSRFNYLMFSDKAAVDVEERNVQYSNEGTYKFSPSWSMELRHQRNQKREDGDDNTRSYSFSRDFISLLTTNKFWENFTWSNRIEGNFFKEQTEDNVNVYSFESNDFSDITGFSYLVFDKKKYFGTLSFTRSLSLRLAATPSQLQMNPQHDTGVSFGYNWTDKFQTIGRYDFIRSHKTGDRNDVSIKGIYRLPFYDKVDVRYEFEYLNHPNNRLHIISTRFNNQFFKKILLDALFSYEISNTDTGDEGTYKKTANIFLQAPLWKQLTLNFNSVVYWENGNDHDISQTYRTYIEVPFGIF